MSDILLLLSDKLFKPDVEVNFRVEVAACRARITVKLEVTLIGVKVACCAASLSDTRIKQNARGFDTL